MDYSQLKDALDKGPLISGTSELNGLYLRELVWIECLKALIQNTKNDQTDRDGITPELDRIISRNVNTACKYATQFMNQRSFFDTCYAPPFLINSQPAEYTSLSPYPFVCPIRGYGDGTPLFEWEWDYILNRYSVTMYIDLEVFGLEYGCGWDYCETKLYIEEIPLATTISLTRNLILASGSDSVLNINPTTYPYIDQSYEDINMATKWFTYWATNQDSIDQTNGITQCPNDVGINTPDGMQWNINPHYFNNEDYNDNSNTLSTTGVINTIPCSGGLKANREYEFKVGFRCKNNSGVCTGGQTFSPTINLTTPISPPYPPVPPL